MTWCSDSTHSWYAPSPSPSDLTSQADRELPSRLLLWREGEGKQRLVVIAKTGLAPARERGSEAMASVMLLSSEEEDQAVKDEEDEEEIKEVEEGDEDEEEVGLLTFLAREGAVDEDDAGPMRRRLMEEEAQGELIQREDDELEAELERDMAADSEDEMEEEEDEVEDEPPVQIKIKKDTQNLGPKHRLPPSLKTSPPPLVPSNRQSSVSIKKDPIAPSPITRPMSEPSVKQLFKGPLSNPARPPLHFTPLPSLPDPSSALSQGASAKKQTSLFSHFKPAPAKKK